MQGFKNQSLSAPKTILNKYYWPPKEINSFQRIALGHGFLFKDTYDKKMVQKLNVNTQKLARNYKYS